MKKYGESRTQHFRIELIIKQIGLMAIDPRTMPHSSSRRPYPRPLDFLRAKPVQYLVYCT